MEIICLEKLLAYRANNIFWLFLSIGFVLLLTSGCSEDKMEKNQYTNGQLQTIGQIPKQRWDKLAQKKIFFGHQSVGFNIIDGIKDLMKENIQIKLNIVETTALSDSNNKLFAHSTIGKNHDPKSKIKDFEKLMEKGGGDVVNIAFFKFCFVDIGAETNVASLFTMYTNSLGQLKKKYPANNFYSYYSST